MCICDLKLGEKAKIHEINGNMAGDSVDLTPCDYLLSSIDVVDLDALFEEEVQIQVYE